VTLPHNDSHACKGQPAQQPRNEEDRNVGHHHAMGEEQRECYYLRTATRTTKITRFYQFCDFVFGIVVVVACVRVD
jgi:hypothetical protein